jgi:hypothetical protein
MTDEKKPNSMAKETLFARFALFGGIALMLILPWLLTQSWSGISFIKTGPIGDTIGGITAPISGLLGAYLVFLALKAQVKANEKIQEQIKIQDEKELKNRSITRIESLIGHFGNTIEKAMYRRRGLGPREDGDIFGPEGIKRFISDYTVESVFFKEDPSLSPIFLTLNSILMNAHYIVDQITKSNIHADDKKYFINILSLHFYPKVYGPSERIIVQREYSLAATKKSVSDIVQLFSDVHSKLETVKKELF